MVPFSCAFVIDDEEEEDDDDPDLSFFAFFAC
jgi:hypothetical protein